MTQPKSRDILRFLIYTKPECSLCDKAKAVLHKVACDFAVEIEEVNIEDDPVTFEKFRHDIPVIFLDDVEIFKHHIDEQKLRKILNNL